MSRAPPLKSSGAPPLADAPLAGDEDSLFLAMLTDDAIEAVLYALFDPLNPSLVIAFSATCTALHHPDPLRLVCLRLRQECMKCATLGIHIWSNDYLFSTFNIFRPHKTFGYNWNYFY